VLADAGCGKTQLSAQLTTPDGNHPAGVLLHGRDLAARSSLDDLARRVTIGTIHVPSFEALLAALDAAGRRAQARLPLIIDGLNEAQDARDWRSLLAAVRTTLANYPYVLLVCTLHCRTTCPTSWRYLASGWTHEQRWHVTSSTTRSSPATLHCRTGCSVIR